MQRNTENERIGAKVVKDVIIKPAVEDSNMYVGGDRFIISVSFDLPIDETKISDEIITLKDSYNNKIWGNVSSDRDNNAIVFTWIGDVGPYTLKIDKVQDTTGLQMEEAYTKSFRAHYD